MNNKKGGVGAKIILVLILMIASAVAGGYGYRVLDGKMAISDAKKDVEAVRVSDYEAPESTEVQGLIDKINKDLETASTRKQVYELMEDFNSDIAKIQTKYQKELEAARKEAEEARNKYNNSDRNNNYNDSDDYDGYNDNGNGYNSNDSDYNNGNGNSNNNNSNNSNNNNSNSNSNDSNAITNDDGNSGRSGLLGNLLGNDD